ncbi:MAG: thioredoxin family protein [Gaiellaceae bacterium]
MSVVAGRPTQEPQSTRPLLVFVHSELSGRCRRTEGFLAQVLQRRRNHATFSLRRLSAEARPDLVERFRVSTLPTLLVVEEKVVRGRLEDPRGCREIAEFLEPWLR